MSKVIYTKKAIRKLPIKAAKQFQQAFTEIANDETNTLNIKKLKGRDGYRLRIGNNRAIYLIEDKEITVIVLAIGSRGDIYK